MQAVAENLWVLRFPLSLFGAQIGRTVTVIRLRSGQLAIHSTAPFTAADVTAIHALGKPAWLIEATLLHDTFARQGCAAFPVPYLAPEGFSAVGGRMISSECNSYSLRHAPEAWHDEVLVLPLEGMPRIREHVFLHHATRTLIVADLVFNFGPNSTSWTRWFFRWGAGIRRFPGMSRLFRAYIRNRAAFAQSVRQMMHWDFDRVIVGHGEVIESDAKKKLADALAGQGFLPA